MQDYPGFDLEGGEIVAHEVVEHDERLNVVGWRPSILRRVALQALYEMDSTDHGVGAVLEHHLQNLEREYEVDVGEADYLNFKARLQRMLTQINEQRLALDNILQAYAPEFPIEQVAIIDRNILRIALYEMAYTDPPNSAIFIDEAVILAQTFGADNSPRFVNGVLGAIDDHLIQVRQQLRPDLDPEGDARAIQLVRDRRASKSRSS
ncbi:MAG: transcription antitermination factor NusB [Anaerolineae bacterium]|nr:transcription antitermination factor NusB [Anaerolineae bacterium]MDW8172461.1 transcription antitermination factor NusB [Anaerolineae bacterium]